MEKEQYKLTGHDGSIKYLEQVEGNTYQLTGDLLEYCGVCLSEEVDGIHHYHFVDPPGGPMIHIGDNIDGNIVKDIYINNGIFITLNKD